MADIEKIETEATPKKEEKETKVAKKPAKKKKFFEGIAKFFKEFKAEFKKIVWFSKKQTINSTIVVLFFMAVISVAISALDLGSLGLLKWLGSLINL